MGNKLASHLDRKPSNLSQIVLYFGLIRMNILMLDTRNVEQTKDVRMYT